MSLSFSISLAMVLIFLLLQSYYAGKYQKENKHLKEEIERLKYDLLQSEIKNLHQQNQELRKQNNISTDTIE